MLFSEAMKTLEALGTVKICKTPNAVEYIKKTRDHAKTKQKNERKK